MAGWAGHFIPQVVVPAASSFPFLSGELNSFLFGEDTGKCHLFYCPVNVQRLLTSWAPPPGQSSPPQSCLSCMLQWPPLISPAALSSLPSHGTCSALLETINQLVNTVSLAPQVASHLVQSEILGPGIHLPAAPRAGRPLPLLSPVSCCSPPPPLPTGAFPLFLESAQHTAAPRPLTECSLGQELSSPGDLQGCVLISCIPPLGCHLIEMPSPTILCKVVAFTPAHLPS